MRRMTIKECAVTILKEKNRPMEIYEICENIIDRQLYDFGAKSPNSVLRIEMARASINQEYSKPYTKKLFRFIQNDKYELI